MFVRVLIVVALLALVIWLVAYASGQAELHRERSAPWPYHLGSVDDLGKRPRPKATPEGEQILKLLQQLRFPRAQNWIAEQVRKDDDAIEPVPASVEASLGEGEPKTAEIVRLAIASEGRIVWPDRWTVRVYVAGAVETLAVVALEQAAAGHREAAWDHVHAMWILASSLAGQSFAYSRVLALELERLANAVARKLPPPAPPWVEEMTARDPRPEAASALQAQSAFGDGPGAGRTRSSSASRFCFGRCSIDLPREKSTASARSPRQWRCIAGTTGAR